MNVTVCGNPSPTKTGFLIFVTGTWVFIFLCCAFSSQSQTTYTWNAAGTASWTTAGNWTPSRTAPATNDILQFNAGNTVTVTNIPSQTIGQLLVTSNSTVNLQFGAANNILTINGLSGSTDYTVDAGSTVNINGTNAGKIFLAAGATALVSGNMQLVNAAHKLDANDAGALVFDGTATLLQDAGCTGNIFNNTGTANIAVFNSGTTFDQKAGANPFGLSQPSSKVVFNAGSLFKVEQNSSIAFTGRTYADLEINATAFNQVATGTSALSINSLTVTKGSLTLNLTGGIDIKGDIAVASGQSLIFTPSSTNALVFSGTTAQHITNAGTLTFGSNSKVEFNNAAGFVFNNDVAFGNTVTFTNGIVQMNNSSVMSLGAWAAVTGASNSSFVAGTVQKTGNTAFTFPVGASSIGYVPLDISAPSLATDEFSCSYVRSSAQVLSSTYASGLDHVSGVDYWNLNRTNGSSTVNVTLHWTTQSSGNGGQLYINDLSKLVVAHFDGSTWNSYGGTYNTGSGFSAGSVTWNSVSNFSPFALASTDNTNPLAVRPIDPVNVGRNNPAAPLQVKLISANPASQYAVLQVTVPHKIDGQIQVFDSRGILILSRTIQLQKNTNEIAVPVHSWPGGMYYITINTILQDKTVIRLIKK